ncbi:hypothetical protein GGR19_003764 [Croceicoccus naphthovorans]|nr:hypothetical protein [Croceicoccus naphthovorans]
MGARIIVDPIIRHREAKDLTDILLEPTSGIERATRFDPPQNVEDFGNPDARNRLPADQRKDIALESGKNALRMLRTDILGATGMPHPRDALEAHRCGMRCLATVERGVTTRSQDVARGKAFRPCFGKGHVRIGAEAQQILLAVKAVLHPPPLGAVRLDAQMKAVPCPDLVGLLAGLGMAKIQIFDRHRMPPFGSHEYHVFSIT